MLEEFEMHKPGCVVPKGKKKKKKKK